MELREFSDSFDVLLNSYSTQARLGEQGSRQDIVLDEYEKSVFLTKAQEELVLSLYTGRNSSGESFEETEELRRYLSNLIEDVTLEPIETSNGIPLGYGSQHKFFTLPDGTGTKPAVWFITYESVNVSSDKCGVVSPMEVIPVRQDEYHRIKDNPFRGANDRRSLRLDLSENNIEIISKYAVTSYYVRYLRKPTPIVLEDMPDGISIEGEFRETPCELHSSLHPKILELAVMEALQSKGIGIKPEQNKK